jgi:solute carrier family 25 2-oxodicarboxylate transporter 21
LARNFVAGAIGGTFATILNTPFDVVKTRIQNQPNGGVLKYNWTLPGVATVYREEGYVTYILCVMVSCDPDQR